MLFSGETGDREWSCCCLTGVDGAVMYVAGEAVVLLEPAAGVQVLPVQVFPVLVAVVEGAAAVLSAHHCDCLLSYL